MTRAPSDRDWVKAHEGPPLSIAHRGASAYAFDNTLRAFQVAHELGADMWEVDVRLTADGIPVAFHDADLKKACNVNRPVSELTARELQDLTSAAGRSVPLFVEVASLAASLGAGIYLDAKEADAATKAIDILQGHGIAKCIVGANTPDYCAELLERGSPYPVSILVGLNRDPFAIADACGAEIIHPCWERAGDRPDKLLDKLFFDEAGKRGLPVVTWHEERPEVVDALVGLPVLGICSDQPEMVSRYRSPRPNHPEIVCHRGACKIAPENTLPAATAAWSAGFDYVEIDVRETSDGHLVVLHDGDLTRTTNRAGPVSKKTLKELRTLDAGSWFDAFFKGTSLPSLDEVTGLAAKRGGRLYVELKQADPIRTAETVLKQLAPENVFFWSWKQDCLREIRYAFPEARLMARPEDFDSLQDCLTTFDADIIEFNAKNANADEIVKVRRAGRKVMIAYMGHDPEEIDRLLLLEPDLFNVNEPFRVARQLAARKPGA
ncbi:glycerophosphodiester phosphodiesterase family protein [Labrenzia sp. VG12]|uniref:glycerophosphodiester phosphodiesterase n=1 Tax=Labrenzia sp. VG12 TaxID=2021862 RepID=UPI0018DFBF4C|nr:glycerophosphodiester phosphodiesterase family protein [Labrenzia sp. VG12]